MRRRGGGGCVVVVEVRFSLLGGPVSMRLLPKKAVSKPVRASESADEGGSASSSERS